MINSEEPVDDIVFAKFINYMKKALLHKKMNYIRDNKQINERECTIEKIEYLTYIENEEHLDLLEKVLNQKEKIVLELHILEKRTYNEIAKKFKVSFSVEKGEFIGIMGASGSGKTTLLNCISTIDRVTAGHIIIDGKDITNLKGNALNKYKREELGFIFQDFNLLDTLTAYENIALALTIQGKKYKEIDTRVRDISNKLGIDEILDKYPYQVSGGQKQRIACARAIVTKPQLILADEPTGALDSKSARQLLETFEYMNKELNATILVVTHDAFSASYTNRILFIRDGKIFNEIIKGDKSRKEFFDEIIDVVTILGGDLNDVF